MLQTIRDNSKGVVAGILIGFLVIIFAVSGSEALFSGSSNSGEVVSVGGESITENQVMREVYRQRQQILNQYGDSVPSEMVSDERLREPAINNLVQRQLLIQYAREHGMAVSNAELDSLIVSFPQFAGESGRFDANRYQQVLRSMGYTPTEYKNMLRQEMLLSQLSSGIGASGFVTDDELQRFAALNYQTRSFQYAILEEQSLAGEVEVSETEIETYYQDNQQQFRQPEQVAVDYIDLSVAVLMEQIELDEQTLRDQYEQNLEAQAAEQTPRRVSHILLEDADDDRVAQVQEALESGEDFAELAQNYSDDVGSSGQGGDLGYISEGLPEAFIDAANQLAEGEVSGPVETDAGVHFIKVTEESGTEVQSFEESRDRIARQLKRVQAETEFAGLMERLSELSYNTDSLEPVAEELSLPMGNTGLFSRNGGTGVAAERPVVEAAFSDEVLVDNNSSHLIELAADRVVVVKKTEHQESYIQELDTVRDQIATRLEAQKTRALLAERGEALLSELQSGASLESVATEAGLDLQQAEAVERSDADVSRELLSHVFALPHPEAGVQNSGTPIDGGYALMTLTEVQPGDWTQLSESEQRALRSNLAQMHGQQEYLAFREQLRANAKISR